MNTNRARASGTNFALLIALDRNGSIPLTGQLETQLRSLITVGSLPSGTPLPPSRQLAADLRTSRGVVVNAYEHLSDQGWLVSRQGSGTVVAPDRGLAPTAATIRRRWRRDLHPEVTDLALFPRAEWSKAFAAAIVGLPTADLGYSSLRGLAQLREQLSMFLARTRGVHAGPDRIVICSGLMPAFAVVRQVLAEAGVRSLGVPRIYHPLEGALTGLPRTVWMDAGPRFDGQERALRRADAVLLNPGHQYPFGTAVPQNVIDQLLDHCPLIIEDDTNAELMHAGPAPAALQGHAPDRTIHLGSLSRALAPGLRLGWIVAPAEFARAAGRVVADSGSAPSAFEQATLAGFIASGDLDRHLRRLRTSYRRRASALSHAVTPQAPELAITIPTSGFHALIDLGDGADEDAVVRALATRGIRVLGMRRHLLHGRPPPPGIVFGYATIAPHAMPHMVADLVDGIYSS